MATATIYTSAGDGGVTGGSNTSWALARSSSGSTASGTSAGAWSPYVSNNAGDAFTYTIIRGFLPFDITTAQIPSGSTINSAYLYLFVNTGNAYSLAGGNFCLVTSTQASLTSLSTSDFTTPTTTEVITRVAFSSISTNAYNTFQLNSTGLGLISPGTPLKLATRASHDIDNSSPSNTNYSGMFAQMSEDTSGTKDPYLLVDYTPPGIKARKAILRPAPFRPM